MPNANTPILIGVSQILQRITDPATGKEPLLMMLDAVRQAAEDAGNPKLLEEVQSMRVIRGIWQYKNPAQYIAEQLNLGNIETVGTPMGGNSVQSAVNQSALDIQQGKQSLIVITGAENGYSQAKAKKAGIDLHQTETPGEYSRMLAQNVAMSSKGETMRGLRSPILVYPIFENALRYQRGETITQHKIRISEMWANFSKVASQNPNAWLRDPVSAESIRTESAKNRMISFPYPKLMNSNNSVDMSAALIMCSVEKARQLGIPESKWVYPWVGTDAHDTYFISNRDNLYSSPAIRIAGSRALELAKLEVHDLDHIDVYSCFPSAVQVAANELNLDYDKPLTVTGGLTFGGGPLNNYVMHSIARMVELLRTSQEKKGMITANGGYLTKHAFGIFSATPPQFDFRHQNVQDEVDATPTRNAVDEHEGKVTIESYTVMYGSDGPASGHAALLLPDGRRTWGYTDDRDLMQEMTQSEFCGKPATIDLKGVFRTH
ncbi:MAG: acetyl-CoA acetyltransferase [Pseudomonadales bacterium]|nr:acetyl-CoA acetyltransferase [Pseudomonadales bacterium]